MKLHHLFEEAPGNPDAAPMIVRMLRKLLAMETPVFFLSMFDGQLTPKEIYDVSEDGVYSDGAPKSIAGTPYTAVKHKAPGFYSWETQSIGDGRGNGSFTIAHAQPEHHTIRKLPSVQGRVDYIIGTHRFLDAWEKEHEGQ